VIATREFIANQKKLAHAMQICGEVAKLYKRKGEPPVWVSVTGSANRQERRHPPSLPVRVYHEQRKKR